MHRKLEYFVGHTGDGDPIPLFVLHDKIFDNLLRRYGKDYKIIRRVTGEWSIYRILPFTHEVIPMIYIGNTNEFGYEYVARLLMEAKKDSEEMRGNIGKIIEYGEKEKRRIKKEMREIRKEEIRKELEKLSKERLITWL